MTNLGSFWSNPVRKTLTRLVTGVSRLFSKYDVNWFVRFLKIAQTEDTAAGIRITDPYRQIAWVNIAVERIASNIARAPWRIYDGDNLVETGPVWQLFEYVSPYMSKYQLWKATGAWLQTRGEAFWLFPPAGVGLPQTLAVVPPHKMAHKLDKAGELTMWEYEVRDGEKIPYLPDELIHFFTWNPWNPYRGVNPLIATEYEMSMEHYANISNLNILRNGSVPQGLLSTEQPLSIDQAKEVKERWEADHKSPEKAHSIAVLGQGVTYTPIQLSPAEMQYFEMKRWSRSTVLARYGIPPVLAGVTDERSPLSGSDTQYQLKNFWNQTLIPIMHLIEDKVKTDFFDRFHLKYTGRFDLSEIAELQEDEEQRRLRIREDVKAGILTINEAREELRRDPVPWGDVWWISFGQVPATMEREAPIMSEPEKVPVDGLFVQEKTPITEVLKTSPWTPEIKTMHWKSVIQDWDRLEGEYIKDLKAWAFDQRSHFLKLAMEEKALEGWSSRLADGMADDAYWATERKKLEAISKPVFLKVFAFSEKRIREIFERLGLDIGISWSLVNTPAIRLIDTRLTKIGGVVDTIRNHVGDAIERALREGLTQAETANLIRDEYNIASNRTNTIARTEIGNVVTDARIAGFESVGIEEHEWLSAQDEDVRTDPYNHLIDGEIAKIGERFSNGLRWPNDEQGAAGNTINCRCLTVPVPGGG